MNENNDAITIESPYDKIPEVIHHFMIVTVNEVVDVLSSSRPTIVET